MKNNEIAETNNAFMALRNFNLTDAISEELSGLSGSFECIKIPSSGSTVFEMPGEDLNNPEAVKEFSAVILYHHPLFAYYKNKFNGGANPPDCGSFDGITGQGHPGGSCKICQYNKFGSSENSGKACKNRRRIYLLREGEIFPMILSLPAGSLNVFTRYLMRLISAGMKSSAVVTRFSLKKATNSMNIVYSQAQFTVERNLSAEEFALVTALAKQVKDFSSRVGYEQETTRDNISQNIDPETGEVTEQLT